jgi:hypothetical protein
MCSAACFITYTIWPSEFIYLGIYYLLGKCWYRVDPPFLFPLISNPPDQTVYVNSLLATLHSREALREKLGEVVLSDSVRTRDFPKKPLSELKFAELRCGCSTSDLKKLLWWKTNECSWLVFQSTL